MAKIKMKHSVTVTDTLAGFLAGKKAAGVSEKTLATYGQHFSAISKHLSPAIPMDRLNIRASHNCAASVSAWAANASKSALSYSSTWMSGKRWARM